MKLKTLPPPPLAKILATLGFLPLLLSTTLHANVEDTFGLGARQRAMASAATATAQDYSATYYNPAGLAFSSQKMQLAFGGDYGLASFQIKVEKNPTAASNAENIRDLLGVSIGFTTTLGGGVLDTPLPCENCNTPVKRSATFCPKCKAEFEPLKPIILPPKFAFGFYMYLPFDRFARVEAIRASTPQVFMFQGRIHKFSILLAGAWRPFPSLAIGLGVSFLTDARLTTQIDQPLADPIQVDVNQSLKGDLAPHLGVRFEPIPHLTLALAYRGELSLKIDGVAGTEIGGVSLFNLQLQGIALFTPHQIALGLSYKFWNQLLLALDLTWYNWKRYRTPEITVANIPGSIPINTQTPPAVGFQDILVPRIGLEYHPPSLSGLTLRSGYAYYPTPIQKQSGETNILDTNRHILSIGGGYSFQLMGFQQTLDAYMQVHLLSKRSNQKQDPSDPYGNSSLKGLYFILGFTYKVHF